MKSILQFIILLIAGVSEAFSQSSDRNYILHEHYTGNTTKVTEVSYYDGLGRLETTARNSGDGTKYIYESTDFITIDLPGNETLPVEGTASPGYMSFSEALSTAQGSSLYNGDASPFTTHEYDALGRETRTMGPGNVWRKSGKGISRCHSYCNDGEVHKFSMGSLSYSGYHAKGALYVETVTDEDGHTVKTYFDITGKKIMERSGVGSDTYYIYDLMGWLIYILPPAISETLGSSGTVSKELIARYAYKYSYDSAGHLTAKTLPGWSGEERYVLDKAHRTVFSQSPVMHEKGLWRFYLYDNLGRMVAEGITSDDAAVARYDKRIVTASYTGTGVFDGWEANLPISKWQLLVTNFFDSYSFLSHLDSQGQSLSFEQHSGYASSPNTAKGRLTGSIVRHSSMVNADNITQSTLEKLASAFYYDKRGNMIQQRSCNILGGVDVTFSRYDSYTNLPTISLHRHTAEGKEAITEDYAYTYDSASRIKQVRYAVNGEQPKVLASYTYDALGRVKSKTLSGKETISYSYDLRSKTKSISSSHFQETLAYESESSGLTPKTPLYGGGIAAMRWKVAGDSKYRGYQFGYDSHDRLSSAHYAEGYTLSQNAGRFDEELTYDAMGNITTLQRTGLLDDGDYGTVDNLTLTYDGNQLYDITDTEEGPFYKDAFHYTDGNSGGRREFIYNGNGNLTEDRDKGIKISYNTQEMPVRVKHSDGSTETNTYDYTGKRLRTVYAMNLLSHLQPRSRVMENSPATSAIGKSIDGTSVVEADKVKGKEVVSVLRGIYRRDSVVYCGNVVYDRGEVRLLNDEGYVTFTDGKPVRHYFLRDHLGSVRVVMNGDGSTVEQVNHYYAFGGVMAGSTGAGIQPLKYNGKELERTNGLNLSDYGARWYDAAAPSWLTPDPLAEKDPGISPYVYCRDNPVRYVDPDGRIWVDPDEAERLKSHISIRIFQIEEMNAKYQGKIESGEYSEKKVERMKERMAENNEKLSHLRQSINDIALLGDDKEHNYALKHIDGGEHHVILNDGVVFIETSSDALSLHEIAHVRQSLEAGELVFLGQYLENSGKSIRKKANNESEAYKIQYSYDGSFPGQVNSINDINNQSVGNIRRSDGERVYPWIGILYENEKKQMKINKKLGL